MRAKRTDKDWEACAQISPYYAVSIYDKFNAKDLDDELVAEFFESGEDYIATVLGFIKNHLDADFQPARCLDFGCGTGRLAIPLAKRFSAVTGVDVSETMLAEAERNCRNFALENIEFVCSDDMLSKVKGKFDFINSYIVFQHIEPRRGEALLKRMIDLLADDGIAALHFTYSVNRSVAARLKYWLHASVPLAHNLINLLKGRKFNHPYTLINQYDLNKLFRMVQDNGCEQAYLRFSNHDGLLGVILMFQKSRVGIVW
ncbi:MAG: class I SAM-dependent methyltransferase [Pyrinomonadaceae bacterium]|nr:class I SAM-dependent methyltransferase [Pyrinomonadaceae bacterium]